MRDVSDQTLHQRGERLASVDPEVPDVDASENDLRVSFGEASCFIDQSIHAPRPRGTAGQRRRAERAMLVAPILNAQQRARARLHVRRPLRRLQPQCRRNSNQVRTGNDTVD